MVILSVTGRVKLNNDCLVVTGPSELTVHYSDVGDVEIFRQHGVGSVIKVQVLETNLFMTVPRLNLFGIFAIINYVKTRELFYELHDRTPV